MADKQRLGFWDYVKGAFNARLPVGGLGQVPLNHVFLGAVAVAGLANPGFWLLGAGVELGYLVLVSQDPRFRKLMDALHKAAASGDSRAKKEAILEGMNRGRADRYRLLESNCQKLIESARSVNQQTLDSVNRLLWIFLQLLASGQMLEHTLTSTNRKKLGDEIEAYKEELESARKDPNRERVAKSLEATLELAQQRLANLQQAEQHWEFIQAELLRIEQQLNLMLEEAALMRDDTTFSNRVDAVMATFHQTQDWMKANPELLGPGEGEALEAPPATFQLE